MFQRVPVSKTVLYGSSMVPVARKTLAWLCIAAFWTYLVCSAAADVPAQQLGTPSVHAAAAGAQRTLAHKPIHTQAAPAASTATEEAFDSHVDQGNADAAAAEAEAKAYAEGVPAGRTLLQGGGASDPNIQLRHIPEDPVPPAVIDNHHPDPSAAAAVPVGVDSRKGTMVKKGFLVHPEHKHLLPIDYKDICLFVLSFMVLSLAAGAGIGEGCLLRGRGGGCPRLHLVSMLESRASGCCANHLGARTSALK